MHSEEVDNEVEDKMPMPITDNFTVLWPVNTNKEKQRKDKSKLLCISTTTTV
jgi:hypothetical protein